MIILIHFGVHIFSISRPESTGKDKMYNKVLEMFTTLKCGFQAGQVETLGKKVITVVTNIFWYLDPLLDKFAARGIPLPTVLQQFSGLYEWKKQHKKQPRVNNLFFIRY